MPATINARAAGSSQEIWPPKLERNIRSQPVGPHMLVDPVVIAEPAPVTLPVSFPVRRPKPL
jgi:hypothetical protein